MKDGFRLSDGRRARVGMRVVLVREALERDFGGHAYDDKVHEITALLSIMIELGPRQTHGGYLRRAPPGAAVTCRDCAGWHVFMHWLRRTNNAQRDLRILTGDYGLIVREWPKSLPERPHGYEVMHSDRGVLTKAWPTPEEAVAEFLANEPATRTA